MLGSRVRAPEGVQSKRLIINDYRSFCFWCVALLYGNSRVEKGHLRGNVYPFVYPVSRRVNRKSYLLRNKRKQMTINTNVIFRKDKIKSNNTAPIHIRFTLNRKIRYASTGITIHISDWDFENQRIKGNNPEMQELQYRIDTKLNEYRRKIKRLEALEVEVTLDNLLETNGRKINCTVGEYLKQTNNQDSATAYYCGIAADEVKKYAEAVTFFDIAIQKKFNIGNAYARKALALDAQKKTAEYVATLEEGLKVDPKNKTMVKNYGLHYLKAGLAAQKAGKAEEAEDCFKKVIPLDHKQYKTNALYSLGVLCYNDGANILKKAAPLANSDADKYAAEKEKADGRFKEALDYLEEAAKISPENENVKKMLPQVKAVMK